MTSCHTFATLPKNRSYTLSRASANWTRSFVRPIWGPEGDSCLRMADPPGDVSRADFFLRNHENTDLTIDLSLERPSLKAERPRSVNGPLHASLGRAPLVHCPRIRLRRSQQRGDLRKKGCGPLDLRVAPHLDFVSGVEPVREGNDFGLDSQLKVILVFGPILLRGANLLPRQELPKILKHLGVRLKARVHPAVQREVLRSESSEHTALAQERGPGIEQARRNHDVGCDAATGRDWPAVVRMEDP